MRTLLALLAVAVASCATVRQPEPGAPIPVPAPLPEPAARTENLAIAGLVDGARADAAAGRLVNAAARSNSWAGSDNALRAENWRLIAHARDARGDAEGARAALEAAERQR